MDSPGVCGGHLLQAAPAKIFEQQDHFVVVEARVLLPGPLKFRDSLGQLGARTPAPFPRLQN
jgi:hypothetical protein